MTIFLLVRKISKINNNASILKQKYNFFLQSISETSSDLITWVAPIIKVFKPGSIMGLNNLLCVLVLMK